MSESRVVRGIGVSPGVSMAPALIVQWEFPAVPDRAVAPDQVEVEVKRLREAVAEVVAQLHELGQKVLRRAGPEEARIFDAQMLMAQDEEFLNSVEVLIRKNQLQRRDRVRVQGARAAEPLVRRGEAARAARRSSRHPASHHQPVAGPRLAPSCPRCPPTSR